MQISLPALHEKQQRYRLSHSWLTFRPFATASVPDDSSPSLLSSGVGSDEFRRKLGIFRRGKARCFSDFSVIVRYFVSASSKRIASSCSLDAHRLSPIFAFHSCSMDKSEKHDENLIDHMEIKKCCFSCSGKFYRLSTSLFPNQLSLAFAHVLKMQRWYFPNRIHVDIILINSALASKIQLNIM